MKSPFLLAFLFFYKLQEADSIYLEERLKNKMEPVTDPLWAGIQMPKESLFMGFDAPNDPARWNEALVKASRGEQVLLDRAMKVLKNPNIFFNVDENMKWIFHNQDFSIEDQKEKNWGSGIPAMINSHGSARAPIVLFGKHYFDREGYEGKLTSIKTLGPEALMRAPEEQIAFKDKIVGLGLPNENWGWASSYFLNRTVAWGLSMDKYNRGPFDKEWKYPDELMQSFLDREEIVVMLVNQHHNLTHPKILSTPLGIASENCRPLWDAMQTLDRRNISKDSRRLLLSMGSNYAYRPAIRDCVGESVPERFYDTGQTLRGSKRVDNKISPSIFRRVTGSSYAVLSMPGLGADSYRTWESLALGSMPVMEKGMGLDRTVYKLPVLLVEDFAEITESLLRQAYVEALYISMDPCADDARTYGTPECMTFEYERMTISYWENLIWEVSRKRSLDPVLRQHPMKATDTDFARPLVPFWCGEGRRECGKGTKRVPRRSCSVDFNKDFSQIHWEKL